MPITRGQSELSAEDTESEGGGNQSEKAVGRIAVVKQRLDTSLKVILHLDSQTQTILESRNERKLQRHKGNLEEKVNKLHDLVSEMIELKFEQGLDIEEVNEWATGPKKAIEGYENSLEAVENQLQMLEEDKETRRRQVIEAREEEKRMRIQREDEEKQERLRRYDIQCEEIRLQRWKEEQNTARLPKLEISKFMGDSLDWNRFWEQFESDIDNTTKPAVTKFSYLRELLGEKPKTEILGLPYTEEGYKKAKEVLKAKYGVTSNIIQAHGKQIMNLPVITSVNQKKIHEFYRLLNVSANSLRTLGKLDTAEILVRETLDKLGPIKADLTRTDPKWQEWGFDDLLTALRDYTLRNPENAVHDANDKTGRRPQWKEKQFQGTENRGPKCVYCNSTSHRSTECDKVKDVSERREILRKNKLCYNCTGAGHGAANCKSRVCRKCSGKHHTSICTTKEELPSHYMIGVTKETIHPTIVVVAGGEKFRALLDTGAGSSFASSTFIKHLGISPTKWENKSIETMAATVNQKMPSYNVTLKSTDGRESLDIKINKLDRTVLTTLTNPGIRGLKETHLHLKGIHFDNEDDRPSHPIHLILGAGDIARIKTSECKMGSTTELVAEKTMFGWTLMGQGETDSSHLYFAKTSQDDYKQLFSLDVLGLQEGPEGDPDNILTEFNEQLTRLPDGRYSTRLPWKAGHPPLPTNEIPSKTRLQTLLKKLERKPNVMDQYHGIIEDQLKQGILEQAPELPTGEKTFYLPHKAVIKESAETTKVRIVFDASAKENSKVPSLNECLHKGPPLQPLLHNVLVRNRLKPIGLTADIKQAFHQIWVDPEDRDVLRFFWIKDLESKEIATLRQTRVPFGSASSPFLLGGTVNKHLENCQKDYPDTVEELKNSTYVDDVISRGETTEQVQRFKEESTELFRQGGFPLHKWHSSESRFEKQQLWDDDQTYAKEELGTKPTETKILGMKWNKTEDTLAVDFRECKSVLEYTKRGVLRSIARVYDPLGVTSPLMLDAKEIYRKTCEEKHTWDNPLQKGIADAWKEWLESLPEEIAVPRSVTPHKEEITGVVLHGFGDASVKGCSAAVYAVVHQNDKTSQGLLTSKSRIAKPNVSIPRLELIAGHMVANLMDNVRKALAGYNIFGLYGWLDSTVALYWIKNEDSDWKQFVSNRVAKIRSKQLTWRHCPTTQNPADIGSRGANLDQLKQSTWWTGPTWLADEKEWPQDITLKRTIEVKEECKVTQKLNTITIKENDLDVLLQKWKLWKVLRITAWMFRFVSNAAKRENTKGVLTTREINRAETYWIKVTQTEATKEEKHSLIASKLGLVADKNGILRCSGRIIGQHPIYLGRNHHFSSLVVSDAHERTLHGGVGLTMAKIRQRWWIEQLRSLVKSVLHKCNTCMRYRAKPLPPPKQAPLPELRTAGSRAFETVGLDFAGPISYKIKKKVQGKCYVALYTCATSRAVHLDLLPDMTAEELKGSLTEFIARRGRPAMIVSDNAKTFVAIAKWLRNLKRSQVLNDYLARREIRWQFNLARSPWWGGFFERMIGVMKNAFRKAVGNANLTFKQLKAVLLEVEITLNNRPLGYLDDDIELQPLTPNGLIHGVNISLPEEEPEEQDEFKAIVKKARYLKRCKDVMWNRWSSEYVRALRERHNQSAGKEPVINVGDVMLIQGEEKNRGLWKTGVVEKLISGKDGVVRGAVLKTGNGRKERPLQHLYPLELSSVSVKSAQPKKLNPTAKEFEPRKPRAAKTKALEKIGQIISDIEDTKDG